MAVGEPSVRALLVGVPAPAPVASGNGRTLAHGDRAVGFAPLGMVADELEWFDELVTKRYGDQIVTTRLIGGSNANTAPVRAAITSLAAHRPAPALLIVYLSGHGVQFEPAEDPDGRTPYDEGFVTNDGYLLDSELQELLDARAPETALVALIDTCHADGMLGLAPVDPLPLKVTIGADERTRLIVASSRKSQTSPNLPTGGVISTVLARALRDGASEPTYRALCAALAEAAAFRHAQQIVTRYAGAAEGFLDSLALRPPAG